MKKILERIGLGLITGLLFFVFEGKISVSASEIHTDDAMLLVTGYEVTNETITPGNDFTLTVKLSNFSKTEDAKNVFVVVSNPDGVAPKYGTVSQTYIESVGAGEETEVSFQYNSWANIQADALNFNVNVYDGESSSVTQLRVPVGRLVDFDVDDVTVPLEYATNRTEYVSARIMNLGNKGVSNVTMVARCNGQDVASTSIGTMSAGTAKTQSVSVTFDEKGTYSFDLVLTYVSGDGTSKEYTIFSDKITVREESGNSVSQSKPVENTDETEEQDLELKTQTQSIVVICVSGILLIAVCCIILLLLQKRK